MNGVNQVVGQLATYQHRTGLNVEVWGITYTPEDTRADLAFPLRLFKANGRKGIPGLLSAIARKPVGSVIFHLHGGFIPDFIPVGWVLRLYKHQYALPRTAPTIRWL